MLSRALLRAFRPQVSRALRSQPFKCLKGIEPFGAPNLPLSLRRFESDRGRFKPPPPPRRRPDKIIHTRWNPEFAQNAKPLITDEQLGSTVRHPRTKWWFAIVVVGGAIFYFINLEEVPISGRQRFNCYSDAEVEKHGERMYWMIMQEAIQARSLLPDWDERSRMVHRVMKRLIPASGLEDVSWEVHVIDCSERNAFVIPGGKVFVYSGILPIAKDDDGLAAILGHEIAHNLARHQAETMSTMFPLLFFRWGLIMAFNIADASGITFGLGQWLGPWLSAMIVNLGVALPASRTQESEADFIGLMIMAKSCYNPAAAVGVWERMEEGQDEMGVPQWLSTHPSSVNRALKMQEWLPKAEVARGESECGVTIEHATAFQKTLGRLGLWRGLTN